MTAGGCTRNRIATNLILIKLFHISRLNRTLYFAAGSSKLIGWSRLKPLGDVWNSANPWVNYVKKNHNSALLGADIKKRKFVHCGEIGTARLPLVQV